MILRRVLIGAGAFTMGASLALGPVTVASASSNHKANHHKTSSHGSNPNGGLCTLERQVSSSTNKTETSLTKAIESGNWAEAKSAMLASLAQSGKYLGPLESALSGAPANVKAAGKVSLTILATEKSLIKSSTSVTQFESSFESAMTTPKIEAAEKVMSAYQTQQCGSATP
jgi:hypothetical protein